MVNWRKGISVKSVVKNIYEIKDIKWPEKKDDPFKVEARDPNSRDWISLEWHSPQ